MTKVVHFVPRSERDAAANLAEFIRIAKFELDVFGGVQTWEDDRWEHNKTRALFSAKSNKKNAYDYLPLEQPFREFAKAYVRYTYSHRPVRSVAFTLQALRCLEAALIEVTGRADVAAINMVVMDASAQKCRDFYVSPEVQCNTGRVLEGVFVFLREKSLVASLPSWKSPFKKPANPVEAIGQAGREYRDRKLPTNDTMLAVADLFAQAEDVEARYFSSIIVLLMCAPSRISEVFALSTDCLDWETDDEGTARMYLRWHGAKGFGATKKWVPSTMQDAVAEAVRRLVDVGSAARAAARVAFEATSARTPVARQRAREAIERYGGPFWPYIDEGRTLLVWDALCLHQTHAFHADRQAVEGSWRLPTANDVNFRLGAEGRTSLFEKRGITLPGGKRVSLTTHQPRHWLSTMSERAGMDDETLARWAGRAHSSDNRYYDHRSEEENFAVAKQVVPFEPAGLLERIRDRRPVTYHELAVERVGTAKATLYGMCVHDYAMAPCLKDRECMTCQEHVCIKGDHGSLERIRILEQQTKVLLDKALRAHEDGEFGADRWVDNHKWKLAHVTALRTAMEHSELPDGTLFRIPSGHDPSHVRRALISHGAVLLPDGEGIVALPFEPRAE